MSSESSHHDEESQGEMPEESSAVYWTAKDITRHSFPVYTSYHSHDASGTSLGKTVFKGEFQSWSNFANEVFAAFNGVEWDKFPELIDITIESNKSISLNKEYYKCGAEISTSGRYVQHVLHPMSAVFQEVGLPYVFGDFGASNEARKTDVKERSDTRKIPDYALLDLKHGSPIMIGEAKHPWNTYPESYVTNPRKNERSLQLFQQYFGQVARDMWLYKKKYAFMTNYVWTVFLRQDLVNGRVKLFYSNAIPNDACLSSVSKNVSVRACMLYLTKKASEDPTFDSQKHIALEDWARQEPKVSRKTGADDPRENTARERGTRTDQPTGSASTTSQPKQVTQAATSSEAKTDHTRKTRSQGKAKNSERETEQGKGKQPIRPKPRET